MKKKFNFWFGFPLPFPPYAAPVRRRMRLSSR